MKNKGFVHVAESIIVIMLLLIVVSQFFFFPTKDTGWEDYSLLRMGRDILHTIDITEDSSIYLNKTGLENTIDDLKPSHVNYGVTIFGIVPPEIRIGCNCSSSQVSDLETILTDLDFNDRTTEFNIVRRVNLTEINRYDDIDVLLIPEYNNLTADEFNELLNFLEKDKGILEISNMKTPDENHKDIFGLDTTGQTIDEGDEAVFNNKENKREPSYDIWKFFTKIPSIFDIDRVDHGSNAVNASEACGDTDDAVWNNITLRSTEMKSMICNETTSDPSFFIDLDGDNFYNPDNEGPFREDETFEFEGFNITVRRFGENKTMLRLPDDYKFTNFRDGEKLVPDGGNIALKTTGNYSDGSSVSVGILHDEIQLTSLNGRSFWVSNVTLSNDYASAENSDFAHLIKNAIILATENKYEPIPVQDVRPGVFGSDTFVTFDGDMFETARIVLTLWFAF